MTTRTPACEEGPGEVSHCQVCDVLATAPSGSIVYVSDLWTATLGYDVPGWILVMANRHSDDCMWGLTDHEASTLGSLMQRLSAAAKAEAGAECVYIMGFGEQNRHFHFMLLTRSASMAADLRGAGLLENAPRLANRNQALRVGSRIRDRLAALSITVAGFRWVIALPLSVVCCALVYGYIALSPSWPCLVSRCRLWRGAGRCGGAIGRWPGGAFGGRTSAGRRRAGRG